MPEISVVVPVYKVEPYLRRCVDSILAQTFTHFELILVDDGSPDNCGAICDEYAAKDSRVHVIHQANGGLSAARNAGIDWAFANSDSEWLSFVDSDDWVHKEYLQRLYQAVIDNDLMISMCSFIETNSIGIDKTFENCVSIKHDVRCVTPGEAYIYNSSTIASYVCGKLFHKYKCWEMNRFLVGRLWEDLAITYKILWKESRIALVEEPLYYYYMNNEGIVRSAWSPKKLDELLGYEEQIPFFKEKNETEIYSRLVKTYINYIFSHKKRVCDASLSTEQKKKYDRLLKRKLQKAIIQYGQEFGITIESKPWIYEAAFPKMMEIYWLLKVLQNKIKRKWS